MTELPNTFLWKLERIGKVTGSRVADIVARTKTGYSASRQNYLAQLVSERLTGVSGESTYTSPAMDWGVQQEARARAAYSFYTDRNVLLCGFVDHLTISMAGASPDGLVGDDGLVELKCPNTATHIETVLTGTIPQKYQVQMLWQLACTGRSWCDFVSFDPRLPDKLSMVVLPFERDQQRIEELEEEVRTFLFELDTVIRRLERVREHEHGPGPTPTSQNLSAAPPAAGNQELWPEGTKGTDQPHADVVVQLATLGPQSGDAASGAGEAL